MKTDEPADKPRLPSTHFLEAFATGSSGCRVECLCGRQHFDAVNQWDWEEGELERLEEAAARDPDQFFPHDGAVASYSVSGAEYAMGCKCGAGADLEKQILKNTRAIAAYLNERSRRLTEEAEKTKVTSAE